MKEEQFVGMIMMMALVGFLTGMFFWISSCQRTEIIKSCFQYGTETQKSECIKGF